MQKDKRTKIEGKMRFNKKNKANYGKGNNKGFKRWIIYVYFK